MNGGPGRRYLCSVRDTLCNLELLPNKLFCRLACNEVAKRGQRWLENVLVAGRAGVSFILIINPKIRARTFFFLRAHAMLLYSPLFAYFPRGISGFWSCSRVRVVVVVVATAVSARAASTKSPLMLLYLLLLAFVCIFWAAFKTRYNLPLLPIPCPPRVYLSSRLPL